MSSICLMTFLLNRAFITPFANLGRILSAIYDDTYIISGSHKEVAEEMASHKVLTGVKMRIILDDKEKGGGVERIAMFILLQVRMSIELIKLPRETDRVLFFMQIGILLPMLTAKLLGKKIFWLLPSSLDQMIKHDDPNLANSFLSHLQTLGYHLANRLILYSPNLIQEWKLEKYRHKIDIASEHIIDVETFSVVEELDQRSNLVGYIGRLSEEKGVLCLMNAIPQILQANNEIEFLIVGDGILYKKIEKFVLDNGLADKANMVGWIPHESLPHYLNMLRLLIMPSYTEGLPNLMLEAMACGTPVLANSVGAIPDIIVDSKTGFFMENNSPECIATNVIRVIDHPDLKCVAQRARALVEREFSFERAVKRWRSVLEVMGGGDGR